MMQRRWREPQVPPSFYGGGETFLYSIERLPDLPPLPVGEAAPPGEAVHVHRWSGSNSFFMLSSRRATTWRWGRAGILDSTSTQTYCMVLLAPQQRLATTAFAGSIPPA